MKKITPKSAREFLSSVKLPPPTRARGGVEGVREIIDFNAQKNQAMIVASDIVSFVKGVSSERRQDIVNASLLAQLVANKKVPDKTRHYRVVQRVFRRPGKYWMGDSRQKLFFLHGRGRRP